MILNWLRCLFGRHDWFYGYRDVGGVRTWNDGSFSTGPEHIGWVCTKCKKLDRVPA